MKEVKIPGYPIILIILTQYLTFCLFDYGYKRMLVKHTFVNMDSIFSLIVGLILLVGGIAGIISRGYKVLYNDEIIEIHPNIPILRKKTIITIKINEITKIKFSYYRGTMASIHFNNKVYTTYTNDEFYKFLKEIDKNLKKS